MVGGWVVWGDEEACYWMLPELFSFPGLLWSVDLPLFTQNQAFSLPLGFLSLTSDMTL